MWSRGLARWGRSKADLTEEIVSVIGESGADMERPTPFAAVVSHGWEPNRRSPSGTAELHAKECEITDLAGHPVIVMRQGEPEDRSDRGSAARSPPRWLPLRQHFRPLEDYGAYLSSYALMIS